MVDIISHTTIVLSLLIVALLSCASASATHFEIPLSARKTIDDMECAFFTQPLNHFVPRGRSPTYQERFCIYDEYARAANNTNGTAPIFFYTGNESPLEQYINQTGLMWELAPKFGARIVFVEHRYEGQSLPKVSKRSRLQS